jgi:hypothetical protein
LPLLRPPGGGYSWNIYRRNAHEFLQSRRPRLSSGKKALASSARVKHQHLVRSLVVFHPPQRGVGMALAHTPDATPCNLSVGGAPVTLRLLVAQPFSCWKKSCLFFAVGTFIHQRNLHTRQACLVACIHFVLRRGLPFTSESLPARRERAMWHETRVVRWPERPFLHRGGKPCLIVWLPVFRPSCTQENMNQLFGCSYHSSISLPQFK